MRKKAKKRLILTSVAVMMIVAAAVGGMLAYLTDKDEVTNTFTIGEVNIDLTEPNFPGGINGGTNSGYIVPNQTIAKDPTVTNIGENDAIVFLKVTVPVESVATANADGTLTEERTGNELTKKNQELFSMNGNSGVAGNSQHKFNTGWIELTGREQVSANGTSWSSFESYADSTKHYYTDDVKYRTYVFGYSAKLKPTQKTSTLFDSVTFLNIVEGQIPKGTTLEINVEAYAIQADCIQPDASGNVIDTSTLDEENLLKIYNVYVNQNS